MKSLQTTRAAGPRRVTQNVSLSLEEQQMARQLAEKDHCGNISLLFRRLLERAWMQAQRGEEELAG